MAGIELFARRVLLGAIALLAAACIAVPATAGDATAPRILVFDSSGSMAALIDRQPKLDVARAIVADEVAGWAADQQVAVIAYGHRRKSDCKDIEVIRPLSTLDAGAIKGELSKLKSFGKTPITAALRKAASITPEGSGADIILVSDGIETCNADPCALAAELRKANARLHVHVVGFGVTEDESKALACIAEKGGGVYSDAKSPGELKTALETTEKAIVEAPKEELAVTPTPDPEPTPPAPPTEAAVTFRLTGGPVNALSEAPARWLVKDPAGQTVFDGESRSLDLKLLPGAYKVHVSVANASADTTVEVTNEPRKVYPVKLDAGELTLFASRSSKEGKLNETELPRNAWIIEPLDGQRPVTAAETASQRLLLAPGRYRASVGAFGFTTSEEIKIEAGEALERTLNLALGKVVLEAALEGEAEPITQNLGIDWSFAPASGAFAPLTAATTARPSFVAPAGDYAANVRINGTEFTQKLQITDGDESIIRVTLPATRLNLSGRFGKDGPMIEDWRLAQWSWKAAAEPEFSDQQTEVSDRKQLVLLPGRWTIRLRSGTAETVQDIEAKPGVTEDVVVSIDGALVKLQGVTGDDIGAFFDIYREGDDPASATPIYSAGTASDGLAETVLATGRYRLILKNSTGASTEAPLDVVAGPPIEMKIALP